MSSIRHFNNAAVGLMLWALWTAMPQAQAEPEAVSVYFFGDLGRFMRVRLGDLSVQALWELSLLDGMGDAAPDYTELHTRIARNGWWAPVQAIHSPADSRIYLLTPIGSQIPRVNWQILALEPPAMVLKGRIVLPPAQLEGAPTMLLSRDGRRLMLESFAPAGPAGDEMETLEIVISTYSTETLGEMETFRQTCAAKLCFQSPLSFGREAYFGSDETIFQHASKITVEGYRPIEKRTVPILELLTEEQKNALAPFEVPGGSPSGKVLNAFGLVDSAAGRALLGAVTPDLTRQALWVVDLVKERVISPVVTDAPPSFGHLTPDGRTVLLEEVEYRPRSSSSNRETAVHKTGRFSVRDAETLQVLGEFRFDELAGSRARSGLVCLAPDRPLAFYRSPKGLFAIRWAGEGELVRIAASFVATPGTHCVFTDK